MSCAVMLEDALGTMEAPLKPSPCLPELVFSVVRGAHKRLLRVLIS